MSQSMRPVTPSSRPTKPRRNARHAFRCPDCDRYLPRDAFRHDASDRYGRDVYCRACRRVRDKTTYNRLASDETWWMKRQRADLARKRQRRQRTKADRLEIVRLAEDWLRAAGLRQCERAARIGVTETTLRNWRRGTHCPEPAAVTRCLAIVRDSVDGGS